ncbi:MAG: 16S rRNA processing protein RimM [Oscillospiraceae bacterium]|jgi:16S rRNA processing protein RimM|nr:16S rRNA processing protein RimM [Oscillospiraceae bacterium]
MEKNFLEAGEIVSTHGIQGEVKILPWADSPEFLLKFKEFYIDGKALTVLSSRVHKTCVLAKLQGIDTPEAATLMRGKRICIDRDKVKLPKGTVFIADLLGCRVITEEGEEIGKIKDVLTMPSSDVYVIHGEKKYMIPAVKEFVKEICVEEGYVRVHLIEGMETDAN